MKSNRNGIKNNSFKPERSEKSIIVHKWPGLKLTWILLTAIITLTIICYSPISKNHFLNWDDDAYVYENNDIKKINIENSELWFKKYYVCDYLPLTIFTYALDYQIGEINPQVYTYTNLIFHICNSILVYFLVLLLIKINGNKDSVPGSNQSHYNVIAALTAILFAIHPLNVESVAWVSERKNVLYVFFFLLSLISYIRYIQNNNRFFYFVSVFIFVCSLLSKGVAVTLSLSIISLDYLFKRKILSNKVLIEKIPYFLLSLIFGIIAIKAQGRSNLNLDIHLFNQLLFACYGFICYLFRLIVPIGLSAYYPYPQEILLIHWFCFFLTVAIIVLLLVYRKRLTRLIVFAISFYVINIIFLIQLIPVGEAIMADRYVYLSSIGLFLVVAIVLVKTASRFSVIYALIPIFVILYGFTTHERIKVWNNSFLFWNEVLENYKNIPKAWLNRGFTKSFNGDKSGSLDDFNEAIRLKPDYKEAYFNRGSVKAEINDYDGALKDLDEAIRIENSYAEAYCNRGNVKRELGDNLGALEDYNKAIILDPNFSRAYNNRGIVNSILEKMEDALKDFSKAISLDTTYVDAYYNRGKVRKIINDYSGAMVDLNEALRLNQRYLSAYILRAKVKFKLNDPLGVLDDCDRALRIDSTLTIAKFIKSAALYQSSKYNETLDFINKSFDSISPPSALIYIRGLAKIKLENKKAGEKDLYDAAKLGFIVSENEITENLK